MSLDAGPILGLIQVTFSSILQIILVCSVGYLMASIGVLDKKMQGKMNKLNVSVFTPALLFSKVAFYLSPERMVELAIVPIGFFVVSFFSAVASVITSRLLRIPRGQRNFVMACSITPNSNTLPVALISSLVFAVPELHWIRNGQDTDTPNDMLGRALTYLVMFSTLGTVQRWSIGAKLLTHVKEEHPTVAMDNDEAQNRSGFRDDVTDFLIDHQHRSTLANRGPFLSRAPETSSPLRNEIFTEEPESYADDAVTPRHPPLSGFAWFWTHWIKAPFNAFVAFMTVPLWSALLSFIVALIPPLQKQLVSFSALVGAIEQMGQCSIPLSILVLGAYFAGDDAPSTMLINRRSYLDEGSFERERWLEIERRRKRATWRTIIAAASSRMIVTPLLLFPLVAYVCLRVRTSVVDDPVFIACACLLIGSPPALTLAQITKQKADPNSNVESLISGTIFVSYIFYTAPITIILVFGALYVNELQDRTI
ncbi:endoplasmic reticulum auxin efflux carrier [Malassezia pachydermatis]|uniref:Endoplasmic reticulum auxin efflux carrier n=1 Tax=Malassezia pachydermatis TaxID=77020 RepID=A0A0M8MRT7_9BASI|nr:endoplasmic reticulum auxin efflux carrier [Malassezia pachydermatis]KOS13044.1 endoplasmic reticulum auxin efflux carrier [Malassezia pachydermatis]